MAGGGSPFEGPGPEAVFQEGLEKGELRIQLCGGCNSHIFYPRAICPHCGSADLAVKPASGKATVYATTVVRNRPEDNNDYNIAVVALEEGPRMMTRVVGIDPGAVKIGMAVEAFAGEVEGERAFLFRPAGGQG